MLDMSVKNEIAIFMLRLGLDAVWCFVVTKTIQTSRRPRCNALRLIQGITRRSTSDALLAVYFGTTRNLRSEFKRCIED